MKIINVKDEVLKDDYKGKIILITKSQLPQVFDAKSDKEIINSFKYIDSNKIESYNDKYLLTFNFIRTVGNKDDSQIEKIGIFSDFKTFSIYVCENKDFVEQKISELQSNKLDYAGILLSLIADATENDYLKLETLENELNAFDQKLSKERDLEKYAKR